MALPEILIVLSSITMQDSLPKTTVNKPVEKIVTQSNIIAGRTESPATPITNNKAEKTSVLRRVNRGGWDHN